MFRIVPLPIIRSFSLYTQQCYVSYSFADSSCELSAKLSQNKFEKLVHLVGFIIRRTQNSSMTMQNANKQKNILKNLVCWVINKSCITYKR